jgi:LETM1 and EF-hand domain-containing protein 1, mitochondrial
MDEAKKPLPKEEKKAAASPSTTVKHEEQITVPKSAATATDKTKAIENASLTEMAADKAKAEGKEVAKKKDEPKKLTLGQKIKKEVEHYWSGTKLLATEVKISSKLALKMAAGYELSRREHRQLQRTVQDLGRLVPFSVFVIVP